MGGMPDDKKRPKPREDMMAVSLDGHKEPSRLRLLAMEWAVKHTAKGDKGLADLPVDVREELESRRSWMGEQR